MAESVCAAAGRVSVCRAAPGESMRVSLEHCSSSDLSSYWPQDSDPLYFSIRQAIVFITQLEEALEV